MNGGSGNPKNERNFSQVLSITETSIAGVRRRSPPHAARQAATERIAAMMRKDFRKAIRNPIGSKVWIRFDDGFSVRECRLVDLSGGGIRILVKAPYDVAGLFSLL